MVLVVPINGIAPVPPLTNEIPATSSNPLPRESIVAVPDAQRTSNIAPPYGGSITAWGWFGLALAPIIRNGGWLGRVAPLFGRVKQESSLYLLAGVVCGK